MRTAAALTMLATAALALAIPALPRRGSRPEFSIVEVTPQGQPGKTTLLSSYRGKVVVLAFVHTTCPHCQAFCQELTKLHVELGPEGFQPIAVAWNQQANLLIPGFVHDLRVDFPVGFVGAYDPVMNFLGFSVMDRPVVPLVAVIDRRGCYARKALRRAMESAGEENATHPDHQPVEQPSGVTKSQPTTRQFK